jgi:hypothetical protein
MGDNSVETRLSVHEAVCAQRYEGIKESLENGKDRMKRIEYLLYITIAAVFLGPGVAALFAKKLLGM